MAKVTAIHAHEVQEADERRHEKVDVDGRVSKIAAMQEGFAAQKADEIEACILMVLKPNEGGKDHRLTCEMVGSPAEMHGMLIDALLNMSRQVSEDDDAQGEADDNLLNQLFNAVKNGNA